MERKDIQELLAQNTYPSVSIFLPVYHAHAGDRQQTSVRIKNLLRQVEERLLQENSRRDITPIMERLEALAAEVDPQQRCEGLALFANASFSKAVCIPTPVEERILINHCFITRDLVVGFFRSPRYRVLSLTEKETHLYEGRRDKLQEVKNGLFPMTRDVEGVVTEMSSTFGVEPSIEYEKGERDYFNRVEKALEEVQDAEPLPLVLVGVERTICYFLEVLSGTRKNKFDIIAKLHGNFENLPLRALEEKVAPLVEESLKQERERHRFRLEEAVGPGRASFGLKQVWKEALVGRIDTLLVEEDYHQPARLHDNGIPRGELEYVTEAIREQPDILDDAVDETVETVLNNRGDVVFYPPGALGERGRIAAILRY
jgi:hypothetical protein